MPLTAKVERWPSVSLAKPRYRRSPFTGSLGILGPWGPLGSEGHLNLSGVSGLSGPVDLLNLLNLSEPVDPLSPSQPTPPAPPRGPARHTHDTILQSPCFGSGPTRTRASCIEVARRVCGTSGGSTRTPSSRYGGIGCSGIGLFCTLFVLLPLVGSGDKVIWWNVVGWQDCLVYGRGLGFCARGCVWMSESV